MDNPITAQPNAVAGNSQADMTVLTPALVKSIADKVYRLLLADLKIERSRLGRRIHSVGYGINGKQWR